MYVCLCMHVCSVCVHVVCICTKKIFYVFTTTITIIINHLYTYYIQNLQEMDKFFQNSKFLPKEVVSFITDIITV